MEVRDDPLIHYFGLRNGIGEETKADAAPLEPGKQNTEKGERLVENMRYGQAISEQGVGGKTTESSGAANQGWSSSVTMGLIAVTGANVLVKTASVARPRGLMRATPRRGEKSKGMAEDRAWVHSRAIRGKFSFIIRDGKVQ